MTNEDRKRFHELLDFALNEAEDYVIAQYARMDLDWHLHKEIYTLHINKTNENST